MESLKGNENDSGDKGDEQNYSNISVKIYDDEGISDDDGHKTLSVQDINELKVLDFFSADDVRQSIKSALAAKAIYKSAEKPVPNIKEISTIPMSNGYEQAKKETEKEEVLLNSEDANKVKETTPSVKKIEVQETGRKRRGRPTKPGSSKNLPKRHKIEDFYIGKLSNFVPFKRKGDSESDFDSESGVLY